MPLKLHISLPSSFPVPSNDLDQTPGLDAQCTPLEDVLASPADTTTPMSNTSYDAYELRLLLSRPGKQILRNADPASSVVSDTTTPLHVTTAATARIAPATLSAAVLLDHEKLRTPPYPINTNTNASPVDGKGAFACSAAQPSKCQQRRGNTDATADASSRGPTTASRTAKHSRKAAHAASAAAASIAATPEHSMHSTYGAANLKTAKSTISNQSTTAWVAVTTTTKKPAPAPEDTPAVLPSTPSKPRPQQLQLQHVAFPPAQSPHIPTEAQSPMIPRHSSDAHATILSAQRQHPCLQSAFLNPHHHHHHSFIHEHHVHYPATHHYPNQHCGADSTASHTPDAASTLSASAGSPKSCVKLLSFTGSSKAMSSSSSRSSTGQRFRYEPYNMVTTVMCQ